MTTTRRPRFPLAVPLLLLATAFAFGCGGSSKDPGPGGVTHPDSGSATPPGSPTAVTAHPEDGQALVSWTAPTDTGGGVITGYRVIASPGGATATAPGTANVTAVTGLTNGTAYTFTVVAINAQGESAPSAPSNPVTPGRLPSAPTAVTATAGDGQAEVSWTAPADDGSSPVTGYSVRSSVGSFIATTSSTSATMTGLNNGTAYTFTVVAINATGEGAPSEPSNEVVPSTLPGAPTEVSATAAMGDAVVTWVAPSFDGGSALTGYRVFDLSGTVSVTVSAPATSTLVTGLTNGTAYRFKVSAINANGESPPSAQSNEVTPEGPPDAPTDVSATAGPGQATVSWTAPANDGGQPVVTYTVTASPGGASATTSATSATVTGLTNGTAYTFTVVATNPMGDSPPSTASSPVTPHNTVPSAPTGVNATAGLGQARVSWNPPSSDGGSVILGYRVTSSPGGFTATVPATPRIATVTGLTNGTAYTFTVVAINGLGNSAPSAPSSPVRPTHCATGSGEVFSQTMEGCPGTSSFSNRADLCRPGTHVCTADEWVARRDFFTPSHDYWTDDDLSYSTPDSPQCGPGGCSGAACFAATSTLTATHCSSPMRVCSDAQPDPEGNSCNWTGCGLNSVSPNQHFGGCDGNPTAGTLCCSGSTFYFVRPTGNDSNSGTDRDHPFKTITHALFVARSGDTVYVGPGLYTAASGEAFPLQVPAGVTLIGDEETRGSTLYGTIIKGGGPVSGSTDEVLLRPGAKSVVAGFSMSSTASDPADVVVQPTGNGVTLRYNQIVSAERYGIDLHNTSGHQVTGNRIFGNYIGFFCPATNPGWTLAENNEISQNDYGGVLLKANCADFGGGNKDSSGNNVIACNAHYDFAGEAPLTYAFYNVWNHAPPTASTSLTDGLDKLLVGDGAVGSNGYSTNPITTCDDGVTP